MGVPKKQYLAGRRRSTIPDPWFWLPLTTYTHASIPQTAETMSAIFFSFSPSSIAAVGTIFSQVAAKPKLSLALPKGKRSLLCGCNPLFPTTSHAWLVLTAKHMQTPAGKRRTCKEAVHRTRRDAKPAISSNNGRSISCQRMEVIKRPYAVCFLPRKAEGFTGFILSWGKGQRNCCFCCSGVRKIVSVSINSISKGSSCP